MDKGQVVIPADESGITIAPTGEIVTRYVFSPKDDITFGEVVALLQHMRISADDGLYVILPAKLQQHFEKE